MAKLKVDALIEEYKEGVEEASKGRILGLHGRRDKPLSPWGAIDIAFQALENINKRLKALERKGSVDTTEGD